MHPDVGILGFEPFLNLQAASLLLIEDGSLTNVRIHPDDTRPFWTGSGADRPPCFRTHGRRSVIISGGSFRPSP